MARILRQELTFVPDATSMNSLAYIPPTVSGEYTEWTVYVEFSSGSSAGQVQLETSFASARPQQYGGTWAPIGSAMAWAAASSQKSTSVTQVIDQGRLNITSAITNGTVRAYVIAYGHN